MPSKLQKAIAAVKDQTSISLAKVKTTTTTSSSSSSALELAILKATTHDEVPITDHQVHLILSLVSSSRSQASACARAIGRRISRTHNWAVALKSLVLVLRLFQDGDPHFPKEVLSAMKRGRKILNLSSFSTPGSSASWHFTAFVRTFALYLDERLHCFLTGKLVHRCRQPNLPPPPPHDMKPPLLIDRVSHWQRLLDRAIGTRPTGPAKSNRLVQTCLYAVVQETFDLYRDVSNDLGLLLDSFFHLQHASSTRAYEACVKASRQFSELATFYDFCKAAGVGGRISEYPSVTGMSEDLLDTLHDFLKDQQPSYLLPTPSVTVHGRGTSLEDLIGDVSSVFPPELESSSSCLSDPGDHEKLACSSNDLASVMSDPTSAHYSPPDLLELDDAADYDGRSRSGWELALLEDTTLQSTTSDHDNNGGIEVDFFTDGSPSPFFASSPHQYNPFLQDPASDAPPNALNSNDGFSLRSTRYVHPTFRADLHGNGNGGSVDLFAEFGEFNNSDGNSNCQLNFPNAFGDASFHSHFKNANWETVSNPIVSTGTSSPFDEFAGLSIGSTQP